MLGNNLLNCDQWRRGVGVYRSKDGKPSQDSPDTVLLTDMVRSCSERFLTTDKWGVVFSCIDGLGVHEVTKVLPASRSFKKIEVQILRNQVNSSTCRHGSSNTLKPSLLAEEWDDISIGSNNSKGVGRSDEKLASKDHVSVTITVSCSSEGWNWSFDLNLGSLFVKSHQSYKLFGVCQVRISVSTVEIIRWNGVHADGFWLSKLINEDGLGVWTVDTVHSVVNHREVFAIEECLDGWEIEDRFQQGDVVCDSRDNFDSNLAASVSGINSGGTDLCDVDIREVRADLVAADGL
mmetsp:Transcript_35529/g.50381  ORF Transcript_35529/g.50381 Transcript_35529/m.50381 type:complete len:292 (+) Transcript_35529:616-1491(+)